MAELKRRSPWDSPPATEPSTIRIQEETPVSPTPARPTEVSKTSTSPVRRINFDVPVDLHKRLRIKTATEGVTIAEVSRRLLESWLEQE